MRSTLKLAILALTVIGAALIVGPAIGDAISAAVAATIFGF